MPLAEMNAADLIACHDCDLIQRLPVPPDGGTLRCIRCGAVLIQKKRNSIDRTLALAVAGLALFILANSFPFLAFKLEAQVRQTTLITGVKELYAQGLEVLAILVLTTTVLVPLLQMGCMLYVLLPLKIGVIPVKLPQVFRFGRSLQPWSMMEVFMLGILVSVVKLAKMAKIVPGIALYSFLALIFVLAAMAASLDPHLIWEKWERRP
jgi:paraquat-inducible protein A